MIYAQWGNKSSYFNRFHIFMSHAFVYQDNKLKKTMRTIVGCNNEKTTTMSKTTRSSKLRKW